MRREGGTFGCRYKCGGTGRDPPAGRRSLHSTGGRPLAAGAPRQGTVDVYTGEARGVADAGDQVARSGTGVALACRAVQPKRRVGCAHAAHPRTRSVGPLRATAGSVQGQTQFSETVVLTLLLLSCFSAAAGPHFGGGVGGEEHLAAAVVVAPAGGAGGGAARGRGVTGLAGRRRGSVAARLVAPAGRARGRGGTGAVAAEMRLPRCGPLKLPAEQAGGGSKRRAADVRATCVPCVPTLHMLRMRCPTPPALAPQTPTPDAHTRSRAFCHSSRGMHSTLQGGGAVQRANSACGRLGQAEGGHVRTTSKHPAAAATATASEASQGGPCLRPPRARVVGRRRRPATHAQGLITFCRKSAHTRSTSCSLALHPSFICGGGASRLGVCGMLVCAAKPNSLCLLHIFNLPAHFAPLHDGRNQRPNPRRQQQSAHSLVLRNRLPNPRRQQQTDLGVAPGQPEAAQAEVVEDEEAGGHRQRLLGHGAVRDHRAAWLQHLCAGSGGLACTDGWQGGQ